MQVCVTHICTAAEYRLSAQRHVWFVAAHEVIDCELLKQVVWKRFVSLWGHFEGPSGLSACLLHNSGVMPQEKLAPFVPPQRPNDQ